MGLGVLIGNELLQQPSIVTPLVLFPWSPTIDSVSNVTYHYEVRAPEFLREMFWGHVPVSDTDSFFVAVCVKI